jgi:hypothetical protein
MKNKMDYVSIDDAFATRMNLSGVPYTDADMMEPHPSPPPPPPVVPPMTHVPSTHPSYPDSVPATPVVGSQPANPYLGPYHPSPAPLTGPAAGGFRAAWRPHPLFFGPRLPFGYVYEAQGRLEAGDIVLDGDPGYCHSLGYGELLRRVVDFVGLDGSP